MDHELLAFLFSEAVLLSGLPALEIRDVPPIVRLSHVDMAHEVCPRDPANCRGMAAYYDTYDNRILVDDGLDLERTTDNSFIVHELVHVLQFKQRGDQIFETCEETVKTETQAYRVQNAYLKKTGQFPRFGWWLALAPCVGTQSTFFRRQKFQDPKLLRED